MVATVHLTNCRSISVSPCFFFSACSSVLSAFPSSRLRSFPHNHDLERPIESRLFLNAFLSDIQSLYL